VDGVFMVSVRAVFGLVLGLFLAVVGWFFGWLVTPPGAQIPISLLVLLSGIGAGIGGFVGWLKPEVHRRVIATHLVLALVGGVAAAWGGFILGQMSFPEGFHNPLTPYKTPAYIVVIVVSSVGANLPSSGFYIFRLCRRREM
jgi:hypothetical protein